MECPFCGYDNDGWMRFCPECGMELPDAPPDMILE